MAKKSPVRDLVKRTKAGDDYAAAQLISLIQWGDKRAKRSVSRFPAPVKNTILIGVTGPGGVGKSSMIGKLIYFFRKESKTVGVMCCDPVSVSGGVFLGDRIRMQDHGSDQEVFIKSLPQYKNHKGAAPEVPYMIKIFGILKKEVIIVETVGAGQENLGFKDMVETLIFVLMPSLGDDIQLLKGGAIQTAGILVINKADLLGADIMFQRLLENFGTTKNADGWQPKIYKVNSSNGEGIAELIEGIKEHKKFLTDKAAQ